MPIPDHLLHTPDAHGAAKAEQVRLKAIEFEAVMDAMVPTGRELALAKTKLEEARMWAIKGIVMQYPAQPLSPFAFNNPSASVVPGVPNTPEDKSCPDFMEKRQQAGIHPAPSGSESTSDPNPAPDTTLTMEGDAGKRFIPLITVDDQDIAALGDSPTLTSWDDPN